MKLEKVPIASLVFDPNNARKHNIKNIEAIKGSLAKFGIQKPIVVGENNVVYAGNGTLIAAKELGWTEIDIVRTNLDQFNATAYALADNRTAELASWDEEILGKTIRALHEQEFGIEDIGFDFGDFNFDSPDYSVVDEDQNIDDMKNEVRKALQIEFELEHYEEAQALVKFWREQGGYVGMMLIEKLKSEKEKLK